MDMPSCLNHLMTVHPYAINRGAVGEYPGVKDSVAGFCCERGMTCIERDEIRTGARFQFPIHAEGAAAAR